MQIVIKPQETRLELSAKVLNWNLHNTSLNRVLEELQITVSEFSRMNDEEFLDTLFSYVHNREVTRGI